MTNSSLLGMALGHKNIIWNRKGGLIGYDGYGKESDDTAVR